ncbi:MAG: IclR family transcriptional regulator [Conexibacter sp.]
MPEPNDAVREPAHPIGSVANALRLLVLLQEHPSLRVSDASEELGVARSTAHRLLAMLASYGLVQQEPRTKAYRAGPVLLQLGLAAAEHDDILLAVLHPFVRELSEAVSETVHIVVLEGANSRFVDCVESKGALRTTGRIGYVYPAHATSGGKALLAELDADELQHLFPDTWLPPLNERTNTSRDKLFEELEHVREVGYSTNFGESEAGVSAIAMAQRTRSGAAPAALAVSVPESRLPESRVPELAEALKRITDRARQKLP